VQKKRRVSVRNWAKDKSSIRGQDRPRNAKKLQIITAEKNEKLDSNKSPQCQSNCCVLGGNGISGVTPNHFSTQWKEKTSIQGHFKLKRLKEEWDGGLWPGNNSGQLTYSDYPLNTENKKTRQNEKYFEAGGGKPVKDLLRLQRVKVGKKAAKDKSHFQSVKTFFR